MGWIFVMLLSFLLPIFMRIYYQLEEREMNSASWWWTLDNINVWRCFFCAKPFLVCNLLNYFFLGFIVSYWVVISLVDFGFVLPYLRLQWLLLTSIPSVVECWSINTIYTIRDLLSSDINHLYCRSIALLVRILFFSLFLLI